MPRPSTSQALSVSGGYTDTKPETTCVLNTCYGRMTLDYVRVYSTGRVVFFCHSVGAKDYVPTCVRGEDLR